MIGRLLRTRLRTTTIALITLAIVSIVVVAARQRLTVDDTTPEIALVMKSLANEFFLTMEQEAHHHQNASEEYVLTANGIRNENDIIGQVRIVENMIARGVDAIIIAPADSHALVPVCVRAVEAGIVVVNIDNRLNADLLRSRGVDIPFIGPDNRKGAALAGRYMAEHLPPNAPVAIIEGIPTAHNSQERVQGFIDAFSAADLNVVAVRTAEWDMEQANVVVTSLLNEYPGLRGIACANDSMALGTVAAVKAAGRQSEVQVVGFDNISAVQTMLESGQILATVDQFAGSLAVFGIEYALSMLKSGADPQDHETPVELVTRETLGR